MVYDGASQSRSESLQRPRRSEVDGIGVSSSGTQTDVVVNVTSTVKVRGSLVSGRSIQDPGTVKRESVWVCKRQGMTYV